VCILVVLSCDINVLNMFGFPFHFSLKGSMDTQQRDRRQTTCRCGWVQRRWWLTLGPPSGGEIRSIALLLVRNILAEICFLSRVKCKIRMKSGLNAALKQIPISFGFNRRHQPLQPRLLGW
jgi:hypothetical protein